MAGDPRRFETLARFIARRFPWPGTQTVLDVGGSTGVLCYHLARLGYDVTTVDPRRRDVKSHFRKLARRGGFPQRMRYAQRRLLPEDDADLFVGLHPDEATELIVRQAVARRRAFVVVPCCVMPLDGVGRTVPQWHDHLCALAAGSHAVRVETLPLDGANIVIWAPAPDEAAGVADDSYRKGELRTMSSSLWEPNFERVLTVLRRVGEPDRVPFFELFHDQPVVEAAMGRPTPSDPDQNRQFRIDFALQYGYDYVRGNHSFGFGGRHALLADDTEENQSRGKRGWRDEHHGPIESWEDFEKYPWPMVEDAQFEDVERLAPMLPEGMKVTTTLPGGVLENLVALMGYEPLCFALIEQPDLVQAVVDKIGEGELSVYRRLADFDHVGLLWLNDDLGFKTQTMISPAHLRQYVFPWYRTLVGYAHNHDKLVVLHSCGNLREVMDDIILAGIDGKHSFEDVIQPVAEFKAQYGRRISTMGGIDVHVLASATEDGVRAYTRRVLEQCMAGGGYALGSGNSVANYVPVGNFKAMLEVGREMGVY